jgi:hypothetical protein
MVDRYVRPVEQHVPPPEGLLEAVGGAAP